MQDNQGRFSHGYGEFANPITQSRIIEGHLKIRDSLLYYHPCANIIWFGGFGTKNGLAPDTSGVATIDVIYKNYKFLNDSAKETIAPIGPAFKRVITQHPTINLWGGDNTHPSLHGSFLTSCVLYTTIFKQSPIHSSYNPGINVAENKLLKNIGHKTTIDSFSFSGLMSITHTIKQSNDSLYVSNYQNCNWFYNNTPFVSSNCSVVMKHAGRYSAIVKDKNGCQLRTLEYTKKWDVSIKNKDLELISLYPNPYSRNCTA